MDLAEFLRLFPMRAQNIMWLFGAGTSAAARIPTAWNMTWDFKRLLYCAERRVSARSVGDLGDDAVRRRLQQHFDAKEGSPAEGSTDEYAYFFEAAYPHEMDRRKYIQQQVASAIPSYGHRAAALLLKHGNVRVIWTTNFDRMVEDSVAALLMTTGGLTVATLDSSLLASQALSEGRFPLLVKLHGDFQSRRLKNIVAELARQDEDFRRALTNACGTSGLAVTGYSGRDDSIMDALESAATTKGAYPGGLFWFHRSDSPLSAQVTRLLASARGNGVHAEAIEIETFDELMGDLVRQIPELPEQDLIQLNARAPRVTNAPLASRGRGWPVLRLNALPILEFPRTCRRVECSIGGAKEVREAVTKAGVQVFATRRNVGVLAFGSDADVRSAFTPFGITGFDLHALQGDRFRNESAELGLLYDALAAALSRGQPLGLSRGRTHQIVVDGSRAADPVFKPLREAVNGTIAGKVPGSGLAWAEALELRLEYRLERLWLGVVPTVWFDVPSDDAVRSRASDFVRERKVRRYNRVANSILDAWLAILFADKQEAEFRALGIGDGLDAVFKLGRTTAFSRRAR